jgi:protein SCO1
MFPRTTARSPRAALRTVALATLAAALAACGPNASRASHAAHTAPATPAAAPDAFSLYDLPSVWHDQTGAELRLPALAGKVRVVALVYTSCQATCPLIVGDLKRIETSLPAARRDDVGFVLVSLDPARDTPGRLAAWAARTGLDPARWTLLNGDADAVRELAATLAVRYQPQANGELAHTNAITVLDRAGAIAFQQVGLGAAARGTVDAVAGLLR